MQKCCPTRKTFWFGFIIPNVQVFLFPVSKLHNRDRRIIRTYEPVNYNFKCLHCDIAPLSYLPAENTAGKGGFENKQNWVNKRNKSRSKRVKLLLLSCSNDWKAIKTSLPKSRKFLCSLNSHSGQTALSGVLTRIVSTRKEAKPI